MATQSEPKDPVSSGHQPSEELPAKDRVWLKLDQEVVQHFRATGRRWHKAANDVLAEYIRRAKT